MCYATALSGRAGPPDPPRTSIGAPGTSRPTRGNFSMVGTAGSAVRLLPKKGCRLEPPELALPRVGKDLRAEHVGHRRIRQSGVVELRQRFADGGIPRLAGGNIDRRARTHEVEGLLRGLQRHAHAAHGARIRLHESPMHPVGRLEFHPVSHRIAGTRVADAATVGRFGIDRVIAVRRGRGRLADRDRRGQQHLVALDNIETLGAGAQFDFHIGRILRLPDRRVESEGIVGTQLGRFAAGQTQQGDGGHRKNKA